MARSKHNANGPLGNQLYELAESIGEDTPRIGNFRVTDGLKALSVGLSADSTAECLHGRAMSGVYKTLQRIGAGLVCLYPQCAVTPFYRTAVDEDGEVSLVYETVDVVRKDGEIESLLMPVKEKLRGFGFANLAVYTTCMNGTQHDSEGPDYTHSALFSDLFFARGMDIYNTSAHCRSADFPFHMEILRGQLAMWAASRYMPDTSIKYSHNLLKLAEDKGLETMVRTYTKDLMDARLAEFVTT